MAGKNSKPSSKGYNIVYERKSQTKQELDNIAFSKDTDALTNYIQRHRDDIDELLPWDTHSASALHYVVNKGWMQGVEALVEAGANINLFDTDYCYSSDKHFRPCRRPFDTEYRATYTPLMRAARSPDLFDIAQYLLAHGADPNLRCPYTGESAVSVAIKHSNAYLVKLLIQKYNVKFGPTKALTMTWNVLCHSNKTNCQQDTAEFIELLLEKGAQIDLHYMHVAVSRGWLKLVEVLVKAGSDVNAFDTDSCYRPYRECVKCFNPAHGKSVSQSCSRSHQPFDSGLETHMRHTPLMIAATSQDLFDIAQYLLTHGPDPHLKCPNTGESAVSIAIKHDNADLVQLLIQKYNVEFDPTKALTMVWNVLCHSTNEECQLDTAEFIELLLEKGAQMELHYMHVAVGRGWLKLVEVFVKRGSDVNVFAPPACYRSYKERNWDCTFSVSGSALQRSIRYTPLMIAARSPQLFEIAQYLLAHGADPHLKCPNNGDSAVSVAIAHCNTALIDLLIQKGPTNILTDICQWRVCQSDSGRYEFQKRKFIKLLIKKGARTGPYYDTVIQCLVPASNISQADLRTYFREGYDINTLCKYYTKSKDKYCVNYVRWFLRHGLNTNAQFIQTCIEKAWKFRNYEIVTLLLHAGVERLAITQWIKLRSFPCLQKQLRECNEIEYNEFQEDDLMEFSDESLHIYPEVKELSIDESKRQYKTMMRLLSHLFTLQGLCRQCLRQSLCQPSPTVVRTLPIPRPLKQYILCHDL